MFAGPSFLRTAGAQRTRRPTRRSAYRKVHPEQFEPLSIPDNSGYLCSNTYLLGPILGILIQLPINSSSDRSRIDFPVGTGTVCISNDPNPRKRTLVWCPQIRIRRSMNSLLGSERLYVVAIRGYAKRKWNAGTVWSVLSKKNHENHILQRGYT
jgi:hypothetical protein